MLGGGGRLELTGSDSNLANFFDRRFGTSLVRRNVHGVRPWEIKNTSCVASLYYGAECCTLVRVLYLSYVEDTSLREEEALCVQPITAAAKPRPSRVPSLA